MSSPHITRPHFPPGYDEHARALLSWSYVEQRLTHAINYWLCTVRPDGRPHAVPKWAVWQADGSPATRHARNIATHPHVVIIWKAARML